jgi:protocatechuate 4,5-dioxygenase, alpha chain
MTEHEKPTPLNEHAEAYEDIPGTWVFDAQRARQGYHLNAFLYSLMKDANRKEFLADEPRYTLKFKMTDAQRAAVLKRDWNKLLELGGVSYALAKLAFTDGKSYQYMASQMTGMTEKEYVDMMLKGGRSPEGWRSKSERSGNA